MTGQDARDDEREALAIRGLDYWAQQAGDPAIRTDCAAASEVIRDLRKRRQAETAQLPARAGLTRLSVNINAVTADALKSLVERQGVSMTEVLRRAISLAVFIDEEIRAGRQIHTVRADGKKRRELIIR